MKKLLLTMLSTAFISLLSLSAQADDFALGVVSEAKLLNDFSVFETNFEAFSVSEQEQELIAQWPKTLKIDIYFATWCHDSEREVPKLLKLLKANKHINVTLIALDYQKTDPQDLAINNNIKYTPTIIIYRDEIKKEELGRIIERPNKSLVQDIAQLLL
ncbi:MULTISPECIES: thioredoxin family protein [unclassified Colwellia]|uniref:thioredoxin family protein n=1 Tax=unclassified Colwellia TaxID=196834 RepID=UPI0015F3D0D0|nr:MULTISPECIES: thioredoxin family protein [unclassified Colwellia]MBA6233310.1 thioredoxin family protein [Colwellia sp. MB02u-7]MBA6236400.1 thioredoxin family protein [Colwellia sp. MB02u-11]MBA6256934.1 thioredoxin family protein [Colwellia sp. MB3u-28]MBA6261060.1 thioredoxin family protein [Colwellia sp. MB3u-41]MBA6298200.1 thioredoxin family protein [Colwellia sp. MB3u-22]